MGDSRGIALNHRQATVLSSEPLNLPSCSGLFPSSWRGLQGEGTFSLSQHLPRGRFYPDSSPPSLFLFFSFVLPQYVEIFLALLSVWDVLPVFSRYSVRIVPHVVAFSIYHGRGELHVLFHHFDLFLSMKLCPPSLELTLYQFNQILAKNIKIILYNVIRLLKRKTIVKNRFLLNVWK